VPQVQASGVERRSIGARRWSCSVGSWRRCISTGCACRSPAAAFCQASLVETQQTFLELHPRTFEWSRPRVPKIRLDNLKSAVKKALKGRRRAETDRFVAVRSHYMFESQLKTPGLERPTRTHITIAFRSHVQVSCERAVVAGA
jgi:hypothetical protein